jgi:hypothetical protein
MIKFLVLAEIEMEEAQYLDLEKKTIEQTEFITSVLADHGRDRGLKIRMRCMENEYNLLDDVCRSADAIAKNKAFDELGEAMLSNAMCPSGNCET